MTDHTHHIPTEGKVDLNTLSHMIETGEYVCDCGATAVMSGKERLKLASDVLDAQRGWR